MNLQQWLVMYEAEQNVQKSLIMLLPYQTAVDARSSRSYAMIFFFFFFSSFTFYLRNESKFVLAEKLDVIPGCLQAMRGLLNGHAIYFEHFSDLIEKLLSLFSFPLF